jgi:toxin CptA
MSIAVSVVVRPSFGLRLAHAGLCCCVMASAAACPGVLAPLACLLAGALGGWHWWRCWWRGPRAIAQRLDISGVGQLRLTVYQTAGTARLQQDSTLWPQLLLLRLALENAPLQVLTVLPDSVPSGDWRALAMACRAIATHSEINATPV